MDNDNNTKLIRYLDWGDVWGFVFVGGGVVIGSSGSGAGGRVHLVDHSTEILIPRSFQSPPWQTLVDCGVVEVGDLVVRSNLTAQRQNNCSCYPPLSRKICHKSPQKV